MELNRQRPAAGEPVPNWRPRPLPPRTTMEGVFVRLEPFDADAHARALFDAYSETGGPDVWEYTPTGPFPDYPAFDDYARSAMAGSERLFFAIADKGSNRVLGSAALMNAVPEHGVIEIGSIAYAPALRRTVAATEAMALFATRVFDELGYRRYEWKCNVRNEASKAAALRLGFSFEGVFRNHMVVRGLNRDTAWFSITAAEWPKVKRGLLRWLSLDNFDAAGRQKRSLAALRDA